MIVNTTNCTTNHAPSHTTNHTTSHTTSHTTWWARELHSSRRSSSWCAPRPDPRPRWEVWRWNVAAGGLLDTHVTLLAVEFDGEGSWFLLEFDVGCGVQSEQAMELLNVWIAASYS